jgi:hypothetical protein
MGSGAGQAKAGNWATKVLEPRSSCRGATATRVRKERVGEHGLWQALRVVNPAAAHLVDDDVVQRGAGHRDQSHPGLSESGIRPCGDRRPPTCEEDFNDRAVNQRTHVQRFLTAEHNKRVARLSVDSDIAGTIGRRRRNVKRRSDPFPSGRLGWRKHLQRKVKCGGWGGWQRHCDFNVDGGPRAGREMHRAREVGCETHGRLICQRGVVQRGQLG